MTGNSMTFYLLVGTFLLTEILNCCFSQPSDCSKTSCQPNSEKMNQEGHGIFREYVIKAHLSLGQSRHGGGNETNCDFTLCEPKHHNQDCKDPKPHLFNDALCHKPENEEVKYFCCPHSTEIPHNGFGKLVINDCTVVFSVLAFLIGEFRQG